MNKSQVKKTMQINKLKLKKARRILRSKNDTKTVDDALSFIVANSEIEIAIDSFYGSLPNFSVK
ncbi:hypothetical protein ACFL2K_02655 [Candidatus Margulisiibacteriota bacterium]